ncbi:hypothetical protein [Streptomyces sp. NA04227]|uniref:hypothetical protein n=1 Tax=Streptomyces sp. NA04227 TaxID=2742136 RepID=UPI0020CA3924|nr:hypothetical protein [Streptomyces sp. NA04227]
MLELAAVGEVVLLGEAAAVVRRLAGVVRQAEPADKAEIYRKLGPAPTYDSGK